LISDCVEKAVAKIQEDESPEMAVQAPGKEMDQLRGLVVNLMKSAEEAKNNSVGTAVGEGADKVAEKATSLFGGAVGSFVGKVSGGVGTAAEAVAGVAGTGIEQCLNAMGQGVQSTIDSLDASFSRVARDLAASKSKEILKVYEITLAECNLTSNSSSATGYRALVRGETPFGEEEYKKCPSDKITQEFNKISATSLKVALEPAVGDAISKSTAVSAFDKAKDQYTAANEYLASIDFLKQFKGEPIQIDLKEYVVQQVIQKMGSVMAVREGEIRKEPSGKVSKFPETFPICFSGMQMTNANYTTYKEELQKS
jgi:hypothetical protein